MPKQSTQHRNAVRRAKCHAQQQRKKETAKRMQNKAQFDAHWKKLENKRSKSRLYRNEKKQREAQHA